MKIRAAVAHKAKAPLTIETVDLEGPKAGEVTLTRELTTDHSFEKWIKEFRSAEPRASRKNGSIVIYDYEGAPITSYSIINAWPKKLTIGTMKAGDTSVLTETLVIAYESVEVE